MRPLLALVLLLAAGPSGAAAACEPDGPITVKSVQFVKDKPGAAAAKQSGSKGAQLGQYDVSVEIFNGLRYSRDLVVLGSLEMIIAPRVLPPELEGKDLGVAVSWGILSGIENIRVKVLQDPKGCASIAVKLFHLDMDDIIKKYFSHDAPRDGEPPHGTPLWPWRFRVSVAILDSEAKVHARGEGMLKLAPEPISDNAKLSPNNSLERTRGR